VKKLVILALMVSILILQCCREAPSKKGSIKPAHDRWTLLLQKHVDISGNVDYKGFQQDSIQLNSYLDLLQQDAPDPETWSDEEQLAYWINLYNAFTVQLVIRHYPIYSIKDIGSKIQIPFVNTPWDIKFIRINGKKLDLNNVEHSILRKEFDEPRIHFAINCASFSCPKLRREAYEPGRLNEQLEEQAVDYINDPERNILTEDHVKLSKIFDWFKGDFTGSGSLIDFINQYSIVMIDPKAKVSYLQYEWTLNER
jgi:hypothetical protein